MAYFSIIIPTYNRAKLISSAIDSILDQTFTDWELVIVDDGSTDNTREIISKYNDERIKYIYQDNAERSAARNTGITHSKGVYKCFLDSDDRYKPNHLEMTYTSIKKWGEPVALFFNNIMFNNGTDWRKYIIDPKSEDETVYDFIVRAVFHTPQACIHHEILEKHRFNPAFRIGEDLELWIRIASDYPIIYSDEDYSIIITEHEDRSINLKKNNVALEHLQMLKYIFSPLHAGQNVSEIVKRTSFSNCYFNIAKYYMFNAERNKAIYWTLKSIIKSPLHIQNKHRFFCIKEMLIGKIPVEYKT